MTVRWAAMHTPAVNSLKTVQMSLEKDLLWAIRIKDWRMTEWMIVWAWELMTLLTWPLPKSRQSPLVTAASIRRLRTKSVTHSVRVELQLQLSLSQEVTAQLSHKSTRTLLLILFVCHSVYRYIFLSFWINAVKMYHSNVVASFLDSLCREHIAPGTT